MKHGDNENGSGANHDGGVIVLENITKKFGTKLVLDNVSLALEKGEVMDAAVMAQRQIIQEGESNLEVHRQRWLAKRQRLESLERVLDKYKEQDREYEARLEQKSADELANLSPSGFDTDEA